MFFSIFRQTEKLVPEMSFQVVKFTDVELNSRGILFNLGFCTQKIVMKLNIQSIALFVCLSLGQAEAIAAAETKRPPNILFILADDLGWRDLSNEGSTYYESPNIDRIANEGMKFTRGYATCQVCSPSRASILTGKYPTNHGITTWIGDASGKAWSGRGRQDSHLPAEYERNPVSYTHLTLPTKRIV